MAAAGERGPRCAGPGGAYEDPVESSRGRVSQPSDAALPGADVRAVFDEGGVLVQLFEAAPLGWVLVEEGRIVYVNQGAETLFGYAREEMIGQALELLVPERFAEQHAVDRAGYERDPKMRPMGALEIAARRKDGSEFFADVKLSPVRIGPRLLVIAIVRDMTERREYERRLVELQRGLEERNQELEQFAFVASHDLQEPLRKIVAFGDRLAKKVDGSLDAQGVDYLARMTGAARRMQSLIEDLLAYSRLTTKAVPFSRVDLDAVLRTTLLDLELALERSHGVVEAGTLGVIDGDPQQLRQLFLNLVGNALKYRRPDAPPRVGIDARRTRGADGRERVVLTVTDNGIGFEPKHAERIFVLFERLHARSSYEGTGIGLAIAKKICERHGGTISASGAPAAGATFTVTLPVRHDRSTDPPEPLP